MPVAFRLVTLDWLMSPGRYLLLSYVTMIVWLNQRHPILACETGADVLGDERGKDVSWGAIV